MQIKNPFLAVPFAFAMLVAISAPMFAGSLKIVNLSILPVGSFYLSNLRENPSLITCVLQNQTAQDQQVRFRMQVMNQTGKTILQGRTGTSTAVPANGVISITNGSFQTSDLVGESFDSSLIATAVLSNQIPAGTYSYVVTAYLADNESDSDQWSESLTITNPDPPQLSYPVGNVELPSALTNGLTFLWGSPAVRSGVSVTYTFTLWEWSANQSPQSVAGGKPTWSQVGLTDSSYRYPSSADALKVGGRYVWQVQALDGAGYGVGANNGKSALETFSLQDYLPPSLQSPVGVQVGTLTPYLTWMPSSAAKKYVVELSDGSSFSSKKTLSTTETSLALIDVKLDYSKKYYWRVQAYDDFGAKVGNVSQIAFFITPDLPPPTLINPSMGAIVGVNPIFQWMGVENADAYVIEFSQNTGMQNAWRFNTNSNQTYFSYDPQLTPNLENGRRYFWRVKALKQGQSWALPSEIGSFGTPASIVPPSYSLLESTIPTMSLSMAVPTSSVDMAIVRGVGDLGNIDPNTLSSADVDRWVAQLDTTKLTGPYAADWTAVSNAFASKIAPEKLADLIQQIDLSALSKLDPSKLDFSKVDLSALSQIDFSKVAGAFSGNWGAVAAKLADIKINGDALSQVTVGAVLQGLFSGGNAVTAKVEKKEVEVIAPIRKEVVLDISGGDKLKGLVLKAMGEKGLDTAKVKIVGIHVNGKDLDPAFIEKVKNAQKVEITFE